jgi:hypothetical protein
MTEVVTVYEIKLRLCARKWKQNSTHSKTAIQGNKELKYVVLFPGGGTVVMHRLLLINFKILVFQMLKKSLTACPCTNTANFAHRIFVVCVAGLCIDLM